MPDLAPWDAARGPAPSAVPPAVIVQAMQARGVAAPPAYVEFVRSHGGKRFRTGANRLEDARGQMVGLGVVYHFDAAQPRYHIAGLWAQVEDEIDRRLVPIFSTDYSGLVCLDYRQSATNPAIVTFDFEAVPENRIISLAPRFEALLAKLDGA